MLKIKLRNLYHYNELLQTHESESTISANSTTIRLNYSHTDNYIQKYKDMMRHGFKHNANQLVCKTK
jgi:hypothetical protein